MKPKAKWTFMVYMAGDTDLDEMRKVESSAYANVMFGAQSVATL